jgi:AraC family transcriptional regulator of adaptative response / DNA-3-methyladenine glycosylase II
MKQDDAYYQAMLARDPRFDGKFFVGVKTTGIYCRPICPARPKRENVLFFQNSHEAERAGYRPCQRCRPESAPNSPAWIGKSATVRRAIRVLHSQDLTELNEDEFSELFGMSARHLRRLFIEEIGKTPKQLFVEKRLNLARKLIHETGLPISEIAFASGFRSIRRFNDAFKERFKSSPTRIRRSPLAENDSIQISLPYRPPFDFEGLIRHYSSHQVGRLEWFDGGRMFRVVTHSGKTGIIAISNDPENSRLLVEIDFPDTSKIHWIINRVRSLFDLDSDPVWIANTLETSPELRGLLHQFPGIRLPSGWDPFEAAMSTILGQLVSVQQGRALVGSLIELLGQETGLTQNGNPIKSFPSPAMIAGADLTPLKTTSARKRTLIRFAEAVANGEILLESTQDVEVFKKKVMEIPGIGPWSASYLALKVLRDADAFPETDLVLKKAVSRLSSEALSQMSPWRGYVAALLWRSENKKAG